jgi:hypothetical protein
VVELDHRVGPQLGEPGRDLRGPLALRGEIGAGCTG